MNFFQLKIINKTETLESIDTAHPHRYDTGPVIDQFSMGDIDWSNRFATVRARVRLWSLVWDG